MSNENNVFYNIQHYYHLDNLSPDLTLLHPISLGYLFFFSPNCSRVFHTTCSRVFEVKVCCIAMEVRPTTVFDLARLKHVVTSGWGTKDLNPMLLLALESHICSDRVSQPSLYQMEPSKT